MGGSGRGGVEVDRATRGAGTTPLIQAVTQKFDELARVLIEHGANPDKSANDGRTPLLMAVQMGSVEVAKLLLEKGADPDKVDPSDGFTPLLTAAQEGSVEVAKLLLEKGANLDKMDPSDGRTPLLTAAQEVERGGEDVAFYRCEAVRECISGADDISSAEPAGTSCFAQLCCAARLDPAQQRCRHCGVGDLRRHDGLRFLIRNGFDSDCTDQTHCGKQTEARSGSKQDLHGRGTESREENSSAYV